MKFTDVTSYLLATGAVALLAIVVGFALKILHDFTKKITAQLAQVEKEKKDIEAVEERINASIDSLKETMDIFKELIYTKGRIDELSVMVSGLFPHLVDKINDEAGASLRAIQRKLPQEIERSLQKLKEESNRGITP